MNHERPTRWTTRGLRRVAAWVAVTIVSSFALYLVGINVFLSTSLFDRVLNQDPDTIYISYERGWSIWPGRVHARNLTIRSSDSKVQFILRIERCDFTFGIRDLALHKTFHVTRVNGSGITFRARQRVAMPDATLGYVEALPPIPGFERIPLPVLTPPDLLERWNDAHYHLWTVNLENVVAEDVREIWIDAVRWQGEARITGGFYLAPIRRVHVDAVHADVRRGQLTALQRTVLEPIAGSLDVSVDPFDPRVAQTADLLHGLTLRTDLHGGSPDLANVPPRLLAPAKIAGPADLRRVAMHVVHGKLAPDTHVDAAAHGAQLDLDGHRVAADLAILADVAADPGGPRLTFHVVAQALAVTRIAEPPGLLVRAPRLEVAGDARALDLTDPLRDLHAVANLRDGELPDAHLLDAYVPPATRPTLSFESGRARGRIEVEMWRADRRVKGAISMDVAELEVRVAKARIRGNTTLAASIESWLWQTGRLEGVKAELKVAKATIARDELSLTTDVVALLRVHDWAWERGDLVLDEASAVLTNVEAKRRRGEGRALSVRRVALSAQSDRFSLTDPYADVTLTGSVAGGEMNDTTALNALLPRGASIAFDAEPGEGRFDLQMSGRVERHVGRGTVALRGRGLGVRGKMLSVRGSVDAAAEVDDWRVHERTLRVKRSRITFGEVAVRIGGRQPDELERLPDLVAARVELRASAKKLDTSHPSLREVDYRVVVDGARMDDVRPLGLLLGPDPLAFAVESGAARAHVDLEVRVSSKTASGGATVDLANAGVRLHETHLVGDFHLAAEVDGFDAALHGVNVSGSKITMRNVRTVSTEASTPAWDGELTLVGGAVRVSERPAFDGLVQLRVDDAKPILALAFQDLPKLVVGMLAAPNLTGQARVAIEPGRSAILGARLRGGDAVVVGQYVVAGDRVRGAATVAMGPVSVGVGIHDGTTSVRLFRLETWMKEEAAASLKLFGEARAKTVSRSDEPGAL